MKDTPQKKRKSAPTTAKKAALKIQKGLFMHAGEKWYGLRKGPSKRRYAYKVLPVNPIGTDSSPDIRKRVQKFIDIILGKQTNATTFTRMLSMQLGTTGTSGLSVGKMTKTTLLSGAMAAAMATGPALLRLRSTRTSGCLRCTVQKTSCSLAADSQSGPWAPTPNAAPPTIIPNADPPAITPNAAPPAISQAGVIAEEVNIGHPAVTPNDTRPAITPADVMDNATSSTFLPDIREAIAGYEVLLDHAKKRKYLSDASMQAARSGKKALTRVLIAATESSTVCEPSVDSD